MNNNNTITKEYFDKTLENYPTKRDLDNRFDQFGKEIDNKLDLTFRKYTNEMKQHMTDLTTGFREEIRGIGDYVLSLDEKISRIDERVTKMDEKLTRVDMNVFHIRGVIKEKVNKKDYLKLEKKVLILEEQKIG